MSRRPRRNRSAPPTEGQRPAKQPGAVHAGGGDAAASGRRRRLAGLFRLALVAAILLAGWLTWPQITVPFSGVAPIVAQLRSDSVFVEDDAAVPADTAKRIRETLGRRPAAMIVLAENSAFTDRPLDVCTAVVDRVDDVELMVSQAGRGFVAQCQGADLPVLTATDTAFDAGLGYSLDRATRMFDDDIPGQAEQLALIMDAAVKGGRLADTERTFSAPITAWLAAGASVVGVVGGAVLVFWGARTGGQVLLERRRRRTELAARYADAEAVVSEAALALLAVDPQDAARTAAAAALAPDYRAVLVGLEKADTAGDLVDVERRARAVVEQLQQVRR